MVLGGLQKNSLIDFPGKVSCVIFISGCNFGCPYCHNPDLAKDCPEHQGPLKEGTFFDFLEMRKGFLDGIVISGGEPTLRNDLIPLCERIKKMGYAVKLDTNGSRPHFLKRLIDDGLIDYVAMDVKTDPFHYSPLITKYSNPEYILSSIQTIMESGLAYEFRTTCVKPMVDALIIEEIAKAIRGAMLYALQRFQGTRVLYPEFFKKTRVVCDNKELHYLRSIAAPWVKKCIVR